MVAPPDEFCGISEAESTAVDEVMRGGVAFHRAFRKSSTKTNFSSAEQKFEQKSRHEGEGDNFLMCGRRGSCEKT